MMVVVVQQTNPTPLVTRVRALELSDIEPGARIAAFNGTTWQRFEVVSAAYQLESTDSTKSWWATMTSLDDPDGRNDTLPRNLAKLGVVQDPNGDWAPSVAIAADDLAELLKAR